MNQLLVSFRRGFSRFIGSQTAVASPEYAVLLGLVLCGVLLGLALFGSHVSASFGTFSSALPADVSGGGPAGLLSAPFASSASYTAPLP